MSLHRPVSFDKVLMLHKAPLQGLKPGLVKMRYNKRIDANELCPRKWSVIDADLLSIARSVPKQRLLQDVVSTSLHCAEMSAQLPGVAANEFVDRRSNRHWEVANCSLALA